MAELDGIVPEVIYAVDRDCRLFSGWHLAPRTLNEYNYLIFLEGTAWFDYQGALHKVGRGDLVCIVPGEEHAAWTTEEDPMHCYAFCFHIYTMNGTRLQEDCLNMPRFSRPGNFEQLQYLFRRLVHHWVSGQHNHRAKCRSIALNILYELDYWQHTNLAPKQTDQVGQVIEYLMSNYHQQITLADMAKIMHLNPVYFSRIFKIATGQTPIQYLTSIRVKKAIDLLLESTETINEISFKVGYKDPSYFSRVFKKVTGICPQQYRQSATLSEENNSPDKPSDGT
ncbi:MAG: AraC family transcriptional regulator [Limnochordia bacterium]|nr:AraC family transcriptional regulator [Limnochordia bacterium]